MLFGYWVKKDTTQTMASVIWKFWRHQFRNSIYVFPTEKQVWTDLSHSGDGLLTGQPQLTTDKLANFLNNRHCFGHLGAEKVYREDEVSRASYGQPLVLKVKIEPPHRPYRQLNRLTRLDVLKQMFEVCTIFPVRVNHYKALLTTCF